MWYIILVLPFSVTTIDYHKTVEQNCKENEYIHIVLFGKLFVLCKFISISEEEWIYAESSRVRPTSE